MWISELEMASKPKIAVDASREYSHGNFMPIRSQIDLTKSRSFFEKPGTPGQRQYEALRA
jgi:hypothetical protein